MTIRGGPDIIEDGLVLHLDAAEPLCFRGEPTTNLMPYTNGVAGRVGWPGGAYTHSIETTGEFAGWEKIVATTTGSIADTVMRVGDVSCTANAQYTATMEFYSPYNNLRFHVSGSHGNYVPNRIGSSNKYYLNFTIPVNGSQGWWLKTISSTAANTAISNGVIYYRRAQFEQKGYYTDFVEGTRGSTVATGGGLLDLTNNGNNGTINRTASPSAGFYNSSNGGSFVFDGSNDYVSTGKVLIPRNGEYHIEGWVYPNDTNTIKMFITQYNNVNDSGRFQCFFLNDGTIRMHDGGGSMTGSLQSYSANIWQHVCFQRNASNECRTYLNSIPSSPGTRTSTLENTNTLIGTRGSSQADVWYNGKISNVRIYNKALSEDEIRQNYNATKGRFGL